MITQLKNYAVAFLLACLALGACDNEPDEPAAGKLQLTTIRVGTYALDLTDPSKNTAAPTDKPIFILFSDVLDVTKAAQAVQLKVKSTGEVVALTFSFQDSDKTIVAQPGAELKANETYVLSISKELKGAGKETFPDFTTEFYTVPGVLEIKSLTIAGTPALNSALIADVSLENTKIEITFSEPVAPATIISQNVYVNGANGVVPSSLVLSEQNSKLTITLTQKLRDLSQYLLVMSGEVKGANSEALTHYTRKFYTAQDPTPDFPVISDEALLTLVQQQTFKYFWDFAHPASGMARERNTSGDLVTSGGSGFGILAIIVGIERNFITRQQGLERLDKILDFLETADRFHGAWSHWINGNTGDVIPFGTNDNGGDLVETSFLMEGLITFRQYLNGADAAEQALIDRINALWQTVEWDWYTRGGQDVLYWHWSPDKQWIMNHQIRGYNECLITYFLAAASPTHTINASVYHKGWANNGLIKNGKKFYDITLPLGSDYGGPLFFTHYSFLGLDPRNLSDTYANYWTQNVNHTLINYTYCVANPKKFAGYSDESWGLTASDNPSGYDAHSPTNDLGVITPTAALSSFPYSPEQSMKALKFFYYKLGDRLWGPYGFYDAYNITQGWTANSYLAIDQGPIVVMMENHRTGLLWNLFMSAPEVQVAMDKLGFQN
ncbi:Ig-like domain-containing protein [Fulvivirgaceae bacterium PWU4]|uniref:Ig-like domain-containing protein n=1 Tax=Chryseosolibacter histidini TaxID=2782349 RepID=A0AAP2DP41_9BACT|nr:glucoamylase family protein [Chryseosolibacter histidini]MBT1699960.1 Ig-like domain-containing protein [Chryseosolibacter histidini]